MDILLYSINEEKNVINKKLTNAKTLTGTLKQGTSIINPVIVVNREDDILTKNYMYISKFKRFYFINDIVVDGSSFQISCSCDVLESYKEDILNSTQVISRQESKFNLKLKDEKIQQYSNTFKVVKKIGSTPFNTNFIDENGKWFPERYTFVLTVTSDKIGMIEPKEG